MNNDEMRVPVRTTAERREASRQAVAARARRAELKDAVRAGRLRLSDVFALADRDEPVSRMRVRDLLPAVPRVGVVTMMVTLDEVGIADSRRLRGLSSRQRAALVKRFG